jgi:hypothetical protein
MITNINPSGQFITLNKYREEHGESTSIGLTAEAETILIWARSKLVEEQRIAELTRTNPTVADAAQALKTAEEQLRVVMALVK